ncbi:MAG: hypothetical protein JWQ94_4994 [Tardiphaga sp.]|nr:hypothetical protein [Tardiphaga sp.]
MTPTPCPVIDPDISTPLLAVINERPYMRPPVNPHRRETKCLTKPTPAPNPSGTPAVETVAARGNVRIKWSISFLGQDQAAERLPA